MSASRFPAMKTYFSAVHARSVFGVLSLFLLVLHFPLCRADEWRCCGERFHKALRYDNNGNVSRYLYAGQPKWLPANDTLPLWVTKEGCAAFSGAKKKMYSLDDIADAYLTWVFPLLGGLLLQMPFESGFVATAVLMARWLGNPAAVLGRTMHIIYRNAQLCKVFGWLTCDYCSYSCRVGLTSLGREVACTHITRSAAADDSSDVARQRHEHDFSALCDAFLILTVLNQFDLTEGKGYFDYPFAPKLDGQTLSVILFALFARNSDVAGFDNSSLPLGGAAESSCCSSCVRCQDVIRLYRSRAALADFLRTTHRRNIVALFVSVVWFCAAMSISISKAFSGKSLQSMNLALGLLMSWMPALVMCAVVDRRPTSSRHARQALQQFLDDAAAVTTDLATVNTF
jgi:hypothetical protein